MAHSYPIMTIDIVGFTLINRTLHVLLMQRSDDPYAGKLALPGGFVHPDEDADIEATAQRVATDKLHLELGYLEQLKVFSGPNRDPRGWSASLAFMVIFKASVATTGEFYPISDAKLHGLPELAFDHNQIVTTALERLRNKTTYSSLPLFLMPPVFSLGDLQDVYEIILQTKLEKSGFRRRICSQGIIEPNGKVQTDTSHRPGRLYRRKIRKLRTFERTM